MSLKWTLNRFRCQRGGHRIRDRRWENSAAAAPAGRWCEVAVELATRGCSRYAWRCGSRRVALGSACEFRRRHAPSIEPTQRRQRRQRRWVAGMSCQHAAGLGRDPRDRGTPFELGTLCEAFGIDPIYLSRPRIGCSAARVLPPTSLSATTSGLSSAVSASRSPRQAALRNRSSSRRCSAGLDGGPGTLRAGLIGVPGRPARRTRIRRAVSGSRADRSIPRKRPGRPADAAALGQRRSE